MTVQNALSGRYLHKPFGPEMVIKKGQVTAVGKTISMKPKNLLGKKERKGSKIRVVGSSKLIANSITIIW